MSWTLLIQLMILAMWFSICGSVMFGTYAEKRFGKGKPTNVTRLTRSVADAGSNEHRSTG